MLKTNLSSGNLAFQFGNAWKRKRAVAPGPATLMDMRLVPNLSAGLRAGPLRQRRRPTTQPRRFELPVLGLILLAKHDLCSSGLHCSAVQTLSYVVIQSVM